jgi:hypothetical protein
VAKQKLNLFEFASTAPSSRLKSFVLAETQRESPARAPKPPFIMKNGVVDVNVLYHALS